MYNSQGRIEDSDGSPFDDFQGEHDEDEGGREDPDDVALEEQLRHYSNIYVVDLADLCQLQGAWCPCQEEAHNHEDRVIHYADWDVLRSECKERCHDQRRDQHSTKQAGNQEFLLDLLLLGISGHGIFGKGVSREIGTQNNENQGDGDTATLINGTSDGVSNEGSWLIECALEHGGRGNDDCDEHSPERRVHEFPQAAEESSNHVACPGHAFLHG